jgi:hypothetical protein
MRRAHAAAAAPPAPTAVMLALLIQLLIAATPAAGSLSFKVTESSAAHPITAMVFEVTAVKGAPAGADWLLLETVDGPHFSGLPAWFPLDARSKSATIKWWSEYFDRNDMGHDPIDPPHNSSGAAVGSFTVSLSAWKGRNVTLLGKAPATETIHYDKTYTQLQWNLTVVPRGLPGTVRLTLSPVGTASKKLAAETDSCWWFGYKYTGINKAGIAMFAEEHTIDMRLPAPNLDLSLSLPGIYYVGIFGSFGTGVSTTPAVERLATGQYAPMLVIADIFLATILPDPCRQPESETCDWTQVSKGAPTGGYGFVSQRAPIVAINKAGTQTTFQPFAVIIPFVNGTVPPLPVGFKGQHAILSAIPGGKPKLILRSISASFHSSFVRRVIFVRIR